MKKSFKYLHPPVKYYPHGGFSVSPEDLAESKAFHDLLVDWLEKTKGIDTLTITGENQCQQQ